MIGFILMFYISCPEPTPLGQVTILSIISCK